MSLTRRKSSLERGAYVQMMPADRTTSEVSSEEATRTETLGKRVESELARASARGVTLRTMKINSTSEGNSSRMRP